MKLAFSASSFIYSISSQLCIPLRISGNQSNAKYEAVKTFLIKGYLIRLGVEVLECLCMMV